jgi:3-oxoacyl-[acyl-carrier-protein] synthase III
VLGLGHHLPDDIVSNEPIADRLGVDDDWIVKRTGIGVKPLPGRSTKSNRRRDRHARNDHN